MQRFVIETPATGKFFTVVEAESAEAAIAHAAKNADEIEWATDDLFGPNVDALAVVDGARAMELCEAYDAAEDADEDEDD